MAKDNDWKNIADDKKKYAAYLCSRDWCAKREKVRKRANNKCERCGILPMDACHHLSYERKYREELEDLQAICNPCHEFTHGKSDFDPDAHRQWMRYLAYCKSAGKRPVDGMIVAAGEPPATFQEAAKLLVIDAIHNYIDTTQDTLRLYSSTEFSKTESIMGEMELLAERVEVAIGLDCAYAAYIRFRRPYISGALYVKTVVMMGLEWTDLTYWPEAPE